MVKTVHPVTFEKENPTLKDFRAKHPSMQGQRPALVLVDEIGDEGSDPSPSNPSVQGKPALVPLEKVDAGSASTSQATGSDLAGAARP